GDLGRRLRRPTSRDPQSPFGPRERWSLALALATLVVMVAGEKINPKLPWALAAVVLGSALSSALSLSHHGVQLLGSVNGGLPHGRRAWFSLHDWSVVATTSLTLLVVIMSQSAARTTLV